MYILYNVHVMYQLYVYLFMLGYIRINRNLNRKFWITLSKNHLSKNIALLIYYIFI